MQQVLFRIPIHLPRFGLPDGIPIYGFGAMLFLAFILCTWLAGRRAQKEGIRRELIQDLAVWLLVGGLVGARLSSVLLEGFRTGKIDMDLFWQFFRIWDGGLILYGSIIGGIIGYFLAYRFVIRKHDVSTLKMADILALAVVVGVGVGRIGCFLNGCCYGGVAGASCPTPVHFPLSSPPRFALVHEGYQTPAGFTIDEKSADAPIVAAVEPNSDAAASGLQPGDAIVALRAFRPNGDAVAIKNLTDLEYAFGPDWPRGKNSVALTVKRAGQEVELPAIKPRTLGLQPTQIYESISMLLLFLLLTAYWPFRRRDGEVAALMMFCYGIHRSLNEILRDDARPVAFEKYISVILIVGGLALFVYLRKRPAKPNLANETPAPATA
jgi:phosphatidylglycerol---prolipoprotein diacylglyceryl transferase